MSQLPTLDELPELQGKAVLVRVDYNVPMQEGRVLDTTRIEASRSTLDELRGRGARVVLIAHRGRPKGQVDPALSLRPIVPALEEILDTSVRFAPLFGDETRRTVEALQAGGIALLENLRFDAGEPSNDTALATKLHALADFYVNDAFGTAHRSHASTDALPRCFEQPVAGRLLERELSLLGGLLEAPERPFWVVLGGAKVTGKAATLLNLLARVDGVLIGGGMANTFLAARGMDMGRSLVEEDGIPIAREIIARARDREIPLELPSDLVVLKEEQSATVAVDGSAIDGAAVDLGPETTERFRSALAGAATIFWNGPLGWFERPPFDRASCETALAIAESDAFSVIGGGETVAAVELAGAADGIDHVSTGGGAALSLLAGKVLPAVEALAGRSS